MAGRLELGFPKSKSVNLKEQAARLILKNVRAQGHTYVELREEGKGFIYFCTLCLARCFNDQVLFDHLKGNVHSQRLVTAKVTLFAPNPFPFNDGVLFCDTSAEEKKENQPVIRENPYWSNFLDLIDTQNNKENLAIVKHSGSNGKVNIDGKGADVDSELCSGKSDVNIYGTGDILVVEGVLLKDKISDIELNYVGLGQIGARFREGDGGSSEIVRIWCEWLGDKSTYDNDTFGVPEHDYAVVTFKYNYELGLLSFASDIEKLLGFGSMEAIENGEVSGRKRKKSFSDPEDDSDSITQNPRLLLDDQSLQRRFMSSRHVRRKLRKHYRLISKEMCDICQQKMLPGKDVATILNLQTGKLACGSRNVNGAFHVYHVSCLVHWFLLCEYEIWTDKPETPIETKKQRKCARKKKVDDFKPIYQTHISSVFCTDCHGTGIDIEGGELEHTKYTPSQLFKYKIKASDGHRAWMKSPEVLLHCSTGFYFPPKSEESAQEKAKPLKLVHFYHAEI